MEVEKRMGFETVANAGYSAVVGGGDGGVGWKVKRVSAGLGRRGRSE